MASLMLGSSKQMGPDQNDQWFFSRAVFGLHPCPIIYCELHPFPGQTLHNLPHSIEFRNVLVCHYAYSLRPHVFEVHTHLLRATQISELVSLFLSRNPREKTVSESRNILGLHEHGFSLN